jgi:6-hydroxycyclohex-1-ene-1-carbonyl-CoA dehydrogenase
MTGGTSVTCAGWTMTAPGAPLEEREFAVTPERHEALVEVAGCGVCHTDLSFLHAGVKTRAPLPLVLGHEIAGVVREVGDGADPSLVGRAVIVPAVLPCGTCALCRAGHRTICRAQVMPGNDRHGGFASHVVVPAQYLCRVGDPVLRTHELWELSVVSDAVATPFEAVRRSGLASGELAVIVGAGGIGAFAVQICRALGAAVIALDVDDRKLVRAGAAGASAVLNVGEMETKEVRKRVRAEAEALGASPYLWKIFEMSGSRAGQETAFALLGFGAFLAVVGFTTDRVEVPLSNLMAFDATARGNWGADPLIYPEMLAWIAEGRLSLRGFVERRPLNDINEVLVAAHRGELPSRVVLAP